MIGEIKTYEERKKAVDLYIKYGKKTSAVIHELGYPDCHILIMWYKDFIGQISSFR